MNKCSNINATGKRDRIDITKLDGLEIGDMFSSQMSSLTYICRPLRGSNSLLASNLVLQMHELQLASSVHVESTIHKRELSEKVRFRSLWNRQMDARRVNMMIYVSSCQSDSPKSARLSRFVGNYLVIMVRYESSYIYCSFADEVIRLRPSKRISSDGLIDASVCIPFATFVDSPFIFPI